MSTRRRDKTPVLDRLYAQHDKTIHNSPNIYTKGIEQETKVRNSTSRGSLTHKGQTRLKNIQKKYSEEQIQRIKCLMEENAELRKQIVQLKVQQFYQFDDKKLKDLLTEVQFLKKQLKKTQDQLQSSQLQNDFLRRSNHQLKVQIQSVKSQILKANVIENRNQRSKNTENLVILSPRSYKKQDEQLTQKIVGRKKKPGPYDSGYEGQFDDFQRGHNALLESKSTTKKDRMKRNYKISNTSQADDQYLLLLQSKRRINPNLTQPQNKDSSQSIYIPMSPRNPATPKLHKSPRSGNQYLVYKSKRNKKQSQV